MDKEDLSCRNPDVTEFANCSSTIKNNIIYNIIRKKQRQNTNKNIVFQNNIKLIGSMVLLVARTKIRKDWLRVLLKFSEKYLQCWIILKGEAPV